MPMLSRVTHILPLTFIRREKVLPVNGRVIVRAGQRVLATDVIAETKLDPGHIMLDVSRGLGLPSDKADKLITRKAGEQVEEGDIIAGPVGGLFPRTVRAPKAGQITAVGDGQVLIELEGSPYELRAGLPGVVAELIADRGAVIETYGALIQGVWGNNRFETGVLSVVPNTPNQELTPDQLDMSMRGAIVLGGCCSRAEIFHTAAEILIRGLVLTSITPDLIPIANQATYPVLVLEGFGKLPIDEATYKILSTNEKREVCINTTPWDRINGIRPELIIPLPAMNEMPQARESDIFAPGQTVRIIHAPYHSKTATITSILPGLTNFPSGLRLPAALLHLESGEEASIPLANLEIIE
jgi:hypothetical protein